jgi:hypothetical protein
LGIRDALISRRGNACKCSLHPAAKKISDRSPRLA